MRILRLKVPGQELIRVPGCDFSNVAAGTSEYLQTALEFGQDWDGAVQVATFYPHFQSQEAGRLIRDGACIMPDGVMAYDTSKIGVVGQRESDQRIITNPITIK